MHDQFQTLEYRAFLARAAFGAHEETVDHVNRQIYRTFDGHAVADVPRAIFKLRHDVYCIECAFLDPADSADGMECDDYDACATHFAAYTMDESLIGTVRLVQPPDTRPFPFELHCHTFDDFRMPPRELCGEISRLAVKRSHRRRRAGSAGVPGLASAGGVHAPANPTLARGERTSPMLLLGMYREMYRLSRQQGVRYWFAAMERSLAYSLERMGFRFEPIGPVADYYGAVTPYTLHLPELTAALAHTNPTLAAWFDEKPLVFARRRSCPARPG